ncbi:MAG: phospho-N-acetylmuramoyl-pentapeptide-transferase [Solobacterium sp.]|nr:phospho-N-acetylmuramoyl-pentapeptide-transferase [Solobacterium sp.]
MFIKYVIGFLSALAIVMVSMPPFIQYLKKLSFQQTINEYSLEDDQKKAGTPIMGGVLFILIPIILTFVLSFKELNLKVLLVMLAFFGYGIIGFIDDYIISIQHDNNGLSPKAKLIMQFVLAALFFFLYRNEAELYIHLPLLNADIHLGFFYSLFILFMFAGSSNAVNLTDGMDGLASGVCIIALIPFLIISLIQQQNALSIFILALMGALLGYLYYNKKPTKVFMGDTGALALGGVLAAIAMVTKEEMALILIAGVPVIETLCVMLQIAAVKTIHKRIFTYTPIHYAFRIKGMPEKSVVYLFWGAEVICAILGLMVALG